MCRDTRGAAGRGRTDELADADILEKTHLIHFAAQKKHLGIYPGPEAVEHFAPVLEKHGFLYSKGAIRFPYDKVPLELIREIAEFCGKE